jgi:hypothetical protein
MTLFSRVPKKYFKIDLKDKNSMKIANSVDVVSVAKTLLSGAKDYVIS